MGAKGMQYAKTYSSAGLKACAAGYEALSTDVFFCEFAGHMGKAEDSTPMVADAISKMTEIAKFVFHPDNMQIAVHGNKDQFP